MTTIMLTVVPSRDRRYRDEIRIDVRTLEVPTRHDPQDGKYLDPVRFFNDSEYVLIVRPDDKGCFTGSQYRLEPRSHRNARFTRAVSRRLYQYTVFAEEKPVIKPDTAEIDVVAESGPGDLSDASRFRRLRGRTSGRTVTFAVVPSSDPNYDLEFEIENPSVTIPVKQDGQDGLGMEAVRFVNDTGYDLYVAFGRNRSPFSANEYRIDVGPRPAVGRFTRAVFARKYDYWVVAEERLTGEILPTVKPGAADIDVVEDSGPGPTKKRKKRK